MHLYNARWQMKREYTVDVAWVLYFLAMISSYQRVQRGGFVSFGLGRSKLGGLY